MSDNIEIARRLRLARERRSLRSVREAAEFLNMNYQTYAAHENGNRGLVRNLETYAKRYNVSLDWLLTGKGPEPKQRSAPDPTVAGWQLAIRSSLEDALEDGQDRSVVASFLAEELARLLGEDLHSLGRDVQKVAQRVNSEFAPDPSDDPAHSPHQSHRIKRQ